MGGRLGLKDIQAALSDAAVKAKLRADTDNAISKGIFGVPTFMIGDIIFWGQDSLDMMLDYLRDPDMFNTHDMRRASTLPVGAARREITKS